MRKSFALKTEWVVFSIVLGLSMIFAVGHLQHQLDAENYLTAKRLAHAFMPLVEKAHHTKDDLALQEVITALTQAPGIAMACIVDPDDKVIAHNHLDEIGKPFEAPHHGEELHSFALKDGPTRWGTLVFSLSENALHQVWLEWALIAMAGVVSLSLLYGIRLGVEARRLQSLRAALDDQKVLGDDERRKKERLTRDLTETQRQTRLWMRSALEKFPDPLLVLDAQQNLVAFNSEAGSLLGLDSKQTEGLSWLDVRWLQDQGIALERSLQTPNVDVAVEDENYNGTFRTETQWTWVKPRPVLRACR